MRANEYIKKYGIDKARELYNSDDWSTVSEYFLISLKRLIESHEVVQKMSGLDECKRKMVILVSMGDDRARILEKAVADVESCQ